MFGPTSAPPGMISVRKNRNGKGTSIGKINRYIQRKQAKRATESERVARLCKNAEPVKWLVWAKPSDMTGGEGVIVGLAALCMVYAAFWIGM